MTLKHQRRGILIDGWIARDRNGELYMYEQKPIPGYDAWTCEEDDAWFMALSETPCEDWLEDMTHETAPIHVALSIVPFSTPQ